MMINEIIREFGTLCALKMIAVDEPSLKNEGFCWKLHWQSYDLNQVLFSFPWTALLRNDGGMEAYF